MSGETRWEVTYRRVQWWEPNGVPQLQEVNRLGDEGWEPFAATDTRDGMTIFLRRAARGEAGKDKGE